MIQIFWLQASQGSNGLVTGEIKYQKIIKRGPTVRPPSPYINDTLERERKQKTDHKWVETRTPDLHSFTVLLHLQNRYLPEFHGFINNFLT